MSRTIVITGASSGIGEALAYRLAADRHALVLAARRIRELETVADEAVRRGAPNAIAIEADVTRRADVERIADRAGDSLGGFDVWVNNAGRGITRHVLDLTDNDIDEIMAVNLKSALYGMQVAVAHFVEHRGGRGQIVNVSSFLGRLPLATHRSAYNGAKAALNALTANLRVDLRNTHPGIAVTLVMPGMVGTAFGRNALGSPPDTPIYSGPHVQRVEDVADIIAGAIEHPVAEVYTNPSSAEMARRYFENVEAFETQSDNPWRAAPGSR